MDGANEHSDEDEYNSASDEDFQPNGRGPGDNDVESSADEAGKGQDGRPSSNRRKSDNEAEDVGFENSGDEATISKGRKKKRKRSDTGRLDEDEEGGEGGLVKTRAQRKQEAREKKPLVDASKSSVDVDAIWAQLSGATASGNDSKTEKPEKQSPQQKQQEKDTPSSSQRGSVPGTSFESKTASSSEKTVTIKRIYEFAGEKREEERVVAADSAEARLYQQQQEEAQEQGAVNEKLQHSSTITTTAKNKPNVRRPLKRKSMFATTSASMGDEESSLTSNNKKEGVAKKLNTLEKSKLDWAEHVDKEGISNELENYHRGKDTYLGRMDFLTRMEAKREDEVNKNKSTSK